MDLATGPTSALQDLILAACAGDADGCRRAIANGASASTLVSRQHAAIALGPNAFLGSLSWASQDEFPVTYFAAKWGSAEIVRELLNNGAEVEASTSLGVTALHMAAQEGRADVAAVLLERAADPNLSDYAGWVPLHYAANHRWASWGGASIDGQLALVKLLASRGADMTATDAEGYSVMHCAVQSGRLELVRLLHRLGAPVNAVTLRHVAPVHVAAECGRSEVLAQVVEWDPSQLDAVDSRGNRPIHHAACRGQTSVVLTLAKLGASLDAKNHYGATPLHLAAQASTRAAETCALLLGLGASPTCLDTLLRTPAEYAALIATKQEANATKAGQQAGEEHAQQQQQQQQQDGEQMEVAAPHHQEVIAGGGASSAAAGAHHQQDGDGDAVMVSVDASADVSAERSSLAQSSAPANREMSLSLAREGLPEVALRPAASARLLSEMLRLAGRGVPLAWRPENNRAHPQAFQKRAREVLMAMYSTPVGALPSGVRDDIIAEVIAPLARAMVWGMMSNSAVKAHQTGLCHSAAAAVARGAILPLARSSSLRSHRHV